MTVPALLLTLIATGAVVAADAAPAPAAAPPAAAADLPAWTGSVCFYLGGKGLNEDHWEPIEGHGALGVISDFGPRRWPVRIAANLIVSGAEDDRDERIRDDQGTTSELQLGALFAFTLCRHAAVDLSGGLAVVTASRTIETASAKAEDDDGALGLWAAVSVPITLGHVTFGPRLGLTAAKVDLFEEEVSAGGGHLGLFVGYRW